MQRLSVITIEKLLHLIGRGGRGNSKNREKVEGDAYEERVGGREDKKKLKRERGRREKRK